MRRRWWSSSFAATVRAATGPPLSGQDPNFAEPRGEIVQLGLHCLRHRARELHVLVDRVHAEDARLAVGGRVELPDQAVAVENREGEVAPAALGRRLVHLERVFEVEELLRADAVVDETVERRQERRPALEVGLE